MAETTKEEQAVETRFKARLNDFDPELASNFLEGWNIEPLPVEKGWQFQYRSKELTESSLTVILTRGIVIFTETKPASVQTTTAVEFQQVTDFELDKRRGLNRIKFLSTVTEKQFILDLRDHTCVVTPLERKGYLLI